MVCIPLRLDGSPQEWFIVELQGEVVKCKEAEPGQDFPIGVFTASSGKAGVVELQIGYHLLEGKITSLKKPLAVLEKEVHPASPGGEQVGAQSSCPINGDETFEVSYKVIGVVRKKLLCKNRPRTLISNPAAMGDKRPRVA